MATVKANGVELYYEERGTGNSVVFVHGSWGDADRWARLTPLLADGYRTIGYDRRGHTRSERVEGRGSIHEDVEDLASLIQELGVAPVHLVGNSLGAIISLRCAGKHPDLFRSVAVHEPPAFGTLRDDPQMMAIVQSVEAGLGDVIAELEAGRNEQGAKLFVDTVAFAPGTWEGAFDEETRRRWTANAPTFLDETRDPDQVTLDIGSLADVPRPLLLSLGTVSPPMFGAVIQKLAAALPDAEVVTIDGAGHAPHATHPEPYAAALREHFARAD